MASGQPVVQVIRAIIPGSSMAQPGVRVGAATPAEGLEYWAFDAATDEYMDFLCRLVGYSSGGLTFTLPWMAASATTGTTRWGVAVRRLNDDAEDVDTTAHSYDFNEADDTAASASGELSYPTITFTDGADMDSWANGELAIVRVYRNADHANDDMTGDAQLVDIFGKET